MRSHKLTPQARALLDDLEALGLPPVEDQTPEEARRGTRERSQALGGEPEPIHRVEEFSIPGPHQPIPIRVYGGGSAGAQPCLIYFHGGGWVICDLDTHDPICRGIAAESGAVVVSVDYRLAPEHKFPAALEDSYAATRWVFANAARLGIDPLRVAVGGDSAGGNIAAVVAMECRDAGGPPLALQVLVYPVTDLSSFGTPSYEEFAEGHYLTRSSMIYFRDQYLPSPADAARPEASPLLAADLRNLPPALILTAECDPLRDEGEAYAKRLGAAGVPVVSTCYTGMFHAFFGMRDVLEESRRAIREVAGALRAL